MNVKTKKHRTIVFVEDNPVVLTAYRNCLEQEGFHVKPATDGLEAMKLLSRLAPDMVILDLMLPKFNGTEVLKFIHSDSRLQAIPIIILSTNSILDAAEEYVLERAHKRLLKDACTPAVMLQAVYELFADTSIFRGSTPAHSSVTSQTSKRKTILFAEDNPVVLTSYRNRLEQGGFQVKPAADGLEAMKILSRLVPDVAVLDLMLPKFSGTDVLKFIHSNPHLNAVSVVILSTSSILAATEEHLLVRANRRLVKATCTPTILLQTIQQLLAGDSAAGQTNGAGPADSKTGNVLDSRHAAA